MPLQDEKAQQHIQENSGAGLQASEAMAEEECLAYYEYRQERLHEARQGEEAAQDREWQVCEEYGLRPRGGDARARTVSSGTLGARAAACD